MKDFAKLHFWYTSFNIRAIRIFIFITLGISSVVGLFSNFPNIFITFFSLFLIFEIFFKFKISKLTPSLEVQQNSGDILDSFTLEIVGIIEARNSLSDVLKELTKLPQIRFIINKADLSLEEIVFIDADKVFLCQSAFNLAKELKGKYVTTMDFFAAYLLSIEPSSKLLFNKNLKEEDFKNIFLGQKTYINGKNQVKK